MDQAFIPDTFWGLTWIATLLMVAAVSAAGACLRWRITPAVVISVIMLMNWCVTRAITSSAPDLLVSLLVGLLSAVSALAILYCLPHRPFALLVTFGYFLMGIISTATYLEVTGYAPGLVSSVGDLWGLMIEETMWILLEFPGYFMLLLTLGNGSHDVGCGIFSSAGEYGGARRSAPVYPALDGADETTREGSA